MRRANIVKEYTAHVRIATKIFDFSSPYSYIASEWIEALAARHGRTVVWRAILLGATFQVTDIKSPVSYPLKRDYTMLDFEAAVEALRVFARERPGVVRTEVMAHRP